VNIHKLIAAISPDVYCDSSSREKVKKIVEEEGFLAAAKESKPIESTFMNLIDVNQESDSVNDLPGLKAPSEKHLLIYDSFGESLEPIYFWILDMMSDLFKNKEKLVDNFISSPGSGHFSEMGAKATKMQEEAMKIIGVANQLVKAILGLIYDLKEFKIRLVLYDKLKSKDPGVKKSGLLSLKQIWMDTVDTKKGNSAMLMFARQFDYATLIDGFMAAENSEAVNKPPKEGGIDLNERVRRILQQRMGEFEFWVKESEKELRKRYDIELKYLKSQLNSVKLYARWAKPYLKAAHQLEQRADPNSAALVTTFNTTIFELTIMGESPYGIDGDISKGDLPSFFSKAPKRDYSSVMIVEFNFRSAPERAQQGYGFRGRAEVIFTSYALSEEELKILRKEITKDDLEDVLKYTAGITEESLDVLKEDIDAFLEDKEIKEKPKEEKKDSNDSNPFSALFSFAKPSSKTPEKKNKLPAPDNFVEKAVRSQASIGARKMCYKIYDIYKKAHGMPSLPDYD